MGVRAVGMKILSVCPLALFTFPWTMDNLDNLLLPAGKSGHRQEASISCNEKSNLSIHFWPWVTIVPLLKAVHGPMACTDKNGNPVSKERDFKGTQRNFRRSVLPSDNFSGRAKNAMYFFLS
jgi:hypothetical protein